MSPKTIANKTKTKKDPPPLIKFSDHTTQTSESHISKVTVFQQTTPLSIADQTT